MTCHMPNLCQQLASAQPDTLLADTCACRGHEITSEVTEKCPATSERQRNVAATRKNTRVSFPETSCCAVCGCTPDPFKMESSSLRGGKNRPQSVNACSIESSPSHGESEPQSAPVQGCGAERGACVSVESPKPRQEQFFYMLSLPKSLSHERMPRH